VKLRSLIRRALELFDALRFSIKYRRPASGEHPLERFFARSPNDDETVPIKVAMYVLDKTAAEIIGLVDEGQLPAVTVDRVLPARSYLAFRIGGLQKFVLSGAPIEREKHGT
jgi:hypothetical protein